jgi:hypothetical protein
VPPQSFTDSGVWTVGTPVANAMVLFVTRVELHGASWQDSLPSSTYYSCGPLSALDVRRLALAATARTGRPPWVLGTRAENIGWSMKPTKPHLTKLREKIIIEATKTSLLLCHNRNRAGQDRRFTRWTRARGDGMRNGRVVINHSGRAAGAALQAPHSAPGSRRRVTFASVSASTRTKVMPAAAQLRS